MLMVFSNEALCPLRSHWMNPKLSKASNVGRIGSGIERRQQVTVTDVSLTETQPAIESSITQSLRRLTYTKDCSRYPGYYSLSLGISL